MLLNQSIVAKQKLNLANMCLARWLKTHKFKLNSPLWTAQKIRIVDSDPQWMQQTIKTIKRSVLLLTYLAPPVDALLAYLAPSSVRNKTISCFWPCCRDTLLPFVQNLPSQT